MNESNLLPALLRGFILGLAIAAPVGANRRPLHPAHAGPGPGDRFHLRPRAQPRRRTWSYGCVATFGLTAISGLLVRQQGWLRLLGGLFLCYLGVKTLLSRPTVAPATAEGQRLRGRVLSTLLLTLTNPIKTILSFTAIFAGLGVGRVANGYSAASLAGARRVPGLGGVVAPLQRRGQFVAGEFDAQKLLWVNRLSGLIIVGFGAAALISLLP